MAQKINPRSLRTLKQSASDFSFFSEIDYASLWKKTTKLSMEFLTFCEKSLGYRRKFPSHRRKINRRYKFKTFYKTRLCVSSLKDSYTVSPILLKFKKNSLSSIYNPIKPMFKRKPFIRKKIKPIFRNRRIFQKRWVQR